MLEEGEVVDLVLRLDIAMLRDAEVDAGARLVEALPVQAAVRQGLARTIDADAAGARADADVLFLLMLEGIEMADAGRLRRPCSAPRSTPRPETPVSRFCRNSASVLPLGAVRPRPVMTMRDCFMNGVDDPRRALSNAQERFA